MLYDIWSVDSQRAQLSLGLKPNQRLKRSGFRDSKGRVTRRTRTITGDKHAFLFTWDDWSSGENAERGYGHYAVTETTFRSLRKYFELD